MRNTPRLTRTLALWIALLTLSMPVGALFTPPAGAVSGAGGAAHSCCMVTSAPCCCIHAKLPARHFQVSRAGCKSSGCPCTMTPNRGGAPVLVRTSDVYSPAALTIQPLRAPVSAPPRGPPSASPCAATRTVASASPPRAPPFKG